MPIISFLALSWDDIFVLACKQSGLRKSERIRITSDVVPHPDFETRICLQTKGFLQIRVRGRSQNRHRQTLNRTPGECYLFPFRPHSAASGTLSSLRTNFPYKKIGRGGANSPSSLVVLLPTRCSLTYFVTTKHSLEFRIDLHPLSTPPPQLLVVQLLLPRA